MNEDNEFKDLYEEESEKKVNIQPSSSEEFDEEKLGSNVIIINITKEEIIDTPDGGIRFNEKKESLKAVEFLIENPGMSTYALRKNLNNFYRRNVVNYKTLERWRKNFYPKVSKKFVETIRKKIKERKQLEKELDQRLIKKAGNTIEYYQGMVEFLERKIQEIEKDRVGLGALDVKSLPSYTNSINSLAKTIKEYQDSIFEYSKFLELERRLDEMIREIATIVLEKFLPLMPANLRKAVVEDFKASMMDYRRQKLMSLNLWDKSRE